MCIRDSCNSGAGSENAAAYRGPEFQHFTPTLVNFVSEMRLLSALNKHRLLDAATVEIDSIYSESGCLRIAIAFLAQTLRDFSSTGG